MVILPPRSSLGSLIGQGLEDIASSYAQHRTALSALKGLGFNDAQARAYANLSPQVQAQAIQAKQQQEAQERSSAIINSILNEGLGGAQPSSYGQQPPTQVQPQPEIPSTGLQSRPASQGQAAIQQATGIAQNPAFRKLQEQQQSAQALQQQQLAQNFGPRSKQLTGEQQAILQNQALQGQKEPSYKDRLEDINRRRRALAAAPLSSKEKIDAHQLLQGQENAIRQEMRDAEKSKTASEKVADKKQARIDAETLPYYTETKKRAEKADEMNARIDQYEAVLDTGKVSSNGFLAFLEELGEVKGFILGDVIGAFGRAVAKAGLSTETQVAKKLGADFMTGAKDVIGSQMPVAEMQMFMERVPNLMQSVEGQRAILRNFRALADKDLATDKTMDAIIDRNADERPKHLQSKVSKEMKDYKSKLRETFRDSIKLIKSPKALSFVRPNQLPIQRENRIRGFKNSI